MFFTGSVIYYFAQDGLILGLYWDNYKNDNLKINTNND